MSRIPNRISQISLIFDQLLEQLHVNLQSSKDMKASSLENLLSEEGYGDVISTEVTTNRDGTQGYHEVTRGQLCYSLQLIAVLATFGSIMRLTDQTDDDLDISFAVVILLMTGPFSVFFVFRLLYICLGIPECICGIIHCGTR